MATNREIVSQVENQYKLINKDTYLNKRLALFTAQSIAESYLAKKARDKSLHRYSSLYKTIPCVEMESIESVSCDIIEFRLCDNLMRSVKKLPRLVESRYGGSIKSVTNISDSVSFSPSTLSEYQRNTKRQGFNQSIKTFYIKDDYLYLPNTEVERVNLYVLAIDQYDLNEICECSKEECKSVWDYEFIITSDLLQQVIRETAQTMAVTVQVPEDENPNMDSNIKSQTV